MKNKVYVLFQTDIWKTKSSRVCFGVSVYFFMKMLLLMLPKKMVYIPMKVKLIL